MKDLAEKRNEDIENVRKKIDELVCYAWESGYKCGQAEHEEQAKAEPEYHVGDVVYYSKLIHPEGKGIIIGIIYHREIEDPEFSRVGCASVYTRDFDIPQVIPLKDLTPTGQHVNVLDFFNKAFIDIQEAKKNENS